MSRLPRSPWLLMAAAWAMLAVLAVIGGAA